MRREGAAAAAPRIWARRISHSRWMLPFSMGCRYASGAWLADCVPQCNWCVWLCRWCKIWH